MKRVKKMKKMKQCRMVLLPVAALLAATLILSACGSKNPPETEAAQTTPAQTMPVQPETNAPSGESGEANVTEPATQDAGKQPHAESGEPVRTLAAYVNTDYDAKYTDNYERCQYSISWDTLKLPEAARETIGYAIEGFNSERRKEGDLLKQTLAKESAELAQMMGNNAPELAAESRLQVHRSDDKLLSLSITNYTYLGGTRPDIQKMGCTFDVTEGATISLEQILKDKTQFLTLCEAQLKEINTFEQRWFDNDYLITMRREIETAPQWWIDADFLYIYFAAGIFGPQAAGDVTLQLLCAEVVSPEYMPDTQGRIRRLESVRLEEHNAVGYALAPDCVLLRPQEISTDSWFDDEEVTFVCGGVTAKHTLFGALVDVFRVETEDGRTYWYLETIGMNDHHEVYVFRYTDKLALCGSIAGGFYGGFAGYPEDLVLFTRKDALGTYTAAAHGSVGADGLPVIAEESYAPVVFAEWHTGKTVRELPVWRGAEKLLLPAGTELLVERIVPEKSVYVRTLAGEVYEIKVEMRNGYELMIDGVSEYDCFESLPYAG